MSNCALWLDHDHAKVITLGAEETFDCIQLKRSDYERTAGHGHHHAHQHGETVHKQDPFFHAIAEKLNHYQHILVMGPGLAKTHFKTHLESHNHGAVKNKIIGVETVDHPTERELAAHARQFFKQQAPFLD